MGLLNQQPQRKAGLLQREQPTPVPVAPTPPEATTMGIVKNTIKGLPQAAKDVGNKIKDFLIPGRGFSDAEITGATSTLKEKALAIPKIGAEIVGGMSALGTKALQSIPGLPQPKIDPTLRNKLEDFAKPKTAGEAQSMRIADIVSLGFGGGMKNVGKAAKIISATEDVAVISRELKGAGLSDEVIKDLSPKMVAVKDPVAVNKMIQEASATKQAGLFAKAEATPPVAPVRQTEPPSLQQAVPENPPTVPNPVKSSLADDTTKMANSQLNFGHLNISDEGKALLSKTIDEVKPLIEKSVGKVLSNKEAIELAEKSSQLFKSPKLRQDTLEWEAKMLNTRQRLAEMAKSETVDREFIDTLLAVKTQGADLGRKLQSLSIDADPRNISAKQAMIDAVLKVNENVDEILGAAQGVDFNDLNQATEFYRKFIKPRAMDWVDLVRYNSMLSSPKTHIINTFSNALNTTTIAPVEKMLVGGLDFFGSKITGNPRQAFALEGVHFTLGYLNQVKEAATRFVDVMRGRRAYTNLDVKHIPIATKGIKGGIVKTLSYPMRLLEATDQFFMALTEGAEAGALQYRASKGVKVGNIETLAKEKAAYRVFRQELHVDEQGYVLDGLDTVTAFIESLRNSNNPLVAIPAKFTVPFIRTPTNIFKQGLEYSPVGFTTMVGAKNKTEQMAKAMIGSAVFAGAATMLTSGRLSWAEPVNADDKAAYRAAGKQPYSIKVGDKWLSYQKLPPAIAFPFALVSAIDDAQKNKALDDNTVDMILSTVAKYGQFLSDQSYAKSIGDFLAEVRGEKGGVERIASNYVQQLIPFRAMGGWLARLTDEVQRKPDTAASTIDQQIQYMMMNIPGLTQKVPARTGPNGMPILQQHRVRNAFSPIQTSTETPFAGQYDEVQKIKGINKQSKAQSDQKKDLALTTYEQMKAMPKAEAKVRFDEIANSDPILARKITELVKDEQRGLTYQDKKVLEMGVENKSRAQYIAGQFNSLQTKEEKAKLWQEYVDKKIITAEVSAQMKEFLTK